MLNFLNKAIQDPAVSDSIHHVMDGSLPGSLTHIISNAEYYGPSLFLLATDVVTAYVFQEPSLLSSLQDKGLTDVVLHALLVKDVPATREVLASLPNVFSALCLNNRGLEAFVECKPFERLFKVLLSPDYLPAMRRRRSADLAGDTATNLGNAMDELMRHQPSLKTSATAAIIKLLEQVCALGRDPRYVCWKPTSTKESTSSSAGPHINMARGGGEVSSDEEDEDEDNGGETGVVTDPLPAPSPSPEKEPVPLVDHMAAANAYIQMFVHVCRTGQAEIKTISVTHWGSELGLTVLEGLSRLYTSQVWESTVLLALCSGDTLPADCMFGRQDMERLVPTDQSPSSPASHGSSGEVTSAMENLTTDSNMEPDMMETASNDNIEIVAGGNADKPDSISRLMLMGSLHVECLVYSNR